MTLAPESPPRAGRRPPWWLWPNVLALDAPAVGVVWQRFLGAAYGIAVPPAASVVLALVVWAVYLTDRWLDAAPGYWPETGDRHLFAREFRPYVGAGAAAVWVTAGATAVRTLPLPYFAAGAAVAAAVAVYFAAVHLLRAARVVAGGGKEILVGALFAAGVGVPLAAEAAGCVADWAPAVGAFAALCWLNCGLIAVWETEPESSSRWRGLTGAAAAAVALAAAGPVPIAGAIATAVCLLGGLHVFRRPLGPRVVRVLADVVLLTPLAWGWS